MIDALLTVPLALIGATALWLTYLWLASAIAAPSSQASRNSRYLGSSPLA